MDFQDTKRLRGSNQRGCSFFAPSRCQVKPPGVRALPAFRQWQFLQSRGACSWRDPWERRTGSGWFSSALRGGHRPWFLHRVSGRGLGTRLHFLGSETVGMLWNRIQLSLSSWVVEEHVPFFSFVEIETASKNALSTKRDCTEECIVMSCSLFAPICSLSGNHPSLQGWEKKPHVWCSGVSPYRGIFLGVCHNTRLGARLFLSEMMSLSFQYFCSSWKPFGEQTRGEGEFFPPVLLTRSKSSYF